METYQDLKSAATIDAMIHYAETLLGIRFKSVKKYRYSAPCPFHADTKDSFLVSVNKEFSGTLLSGLTSLESFADFIDGLEIYN